MATNEGGDVTIESVIGELVGSINEVLGMITVEVGVGVLTGDVLVKVAGVLFT